MGYVVSSWASSISSARENTKNLKNYEAGSDLIFKKSSWNRSNGNSITWHHKKAVSPFIIFSHWWHLPPLGFLSHFWLLKNHLLLHVFWVSFCAHDCFLPPRNASQVLCLWWKHLLFFRTIMDCFHQFFFPCKSYTMEVVTCTQFVIWYDFQ